MGENRMPKQNHFPRAKAYKKLALIQHPMRSCHEVHERELLESLNKIEPTMAVGRSAPGRNMLTFIHIFDS
jgi:hypothetical protein